jgi:hypothetical protein
VQLLTLQACWIAAAAAVLQDCWMLQVLCLLLLLLLM